MPKPPLTKEDSVLEREIIATLVAGHKEWRPDLDFPESYSDMQGAVRGLLRMFKVERRPLPEPLRIVCHKCDGLGEFIDAATVTEGYSKRTSCDLCKSRGYLKEF